MNRELIYLDYQATTPCDPRVIDAMLPVFREDFGNAASRQHRAGLRAAELVEKARSSVASLIGADAREIVFTSGATEAINLAIKGAAGHPTARGKHIVTCRTDHRATLDACESLERLGHEVSYLPVASDGRLDPDDVRAAIRDDTVLVSVLHANNEIGVLQPTAEIGEICKAKAVLFHVDVVQSLGTLPISVENLSADLASISAHKIYGPKGAGALYVRRRRPHVRLVPQMDGGGHERGMRSGTLNVPGIVGFGAACDILMNEREGDDAKLRGFQRRMLELLRTGHPDVIVNGSLRHRLTSNLNLTFPGVDSRRILESLEYTAVSSGAACSAGSGDSSYVLECLDSPSAKEFGGLRISSGRCTTAAEIDAAAADILQSVKSCQNHPAPDATDCDDACA